MVATPNDDDEQGGNALLTLPEEADLAGWLADLVLADGNEAPRGPAVVLVTSEPEGLALVRQVRARLERPYLSYLRAIGRHSTQARWGNGAELLLIAPDDVRDVPRLVRGDALDGPRTRVACVPAIFAGTELVLLLACILLPGERGAIYRYAVPDTLAERAGALQTLDEIERYAALEREQRMLARTLASVLTIPVTLQQWDVQGLRGRMWRTQDDRVTIVRLRIEGKARYVALANQRTVRGWTDEDAPALALIDGIFGDGYPTLEQLLQYNTMELGDLAADEPGVGYFDPPPPAEAEGIEASQARRGAAS